MNSSYKEWVKALNINPIQVEEWLQQLPRGDSLTFWALEKGKLQVSTYLMWAQEHYGLALLKPDFFQNEHPNRKLWQQIQGVANWSPSLLPLAEWDGVIFVGCVEPPEDIQWSFPVSYLLASHRDLKQLWQDYQVQEKSFNDLPPPPTEQKPDLPPPTQSEAAAPLSPPADETPEVSAQEQAPEGLSLSFDLNTSTATKGPNQGFNFDDLAASLDQSPQPPSETQAPAGLDGSSINPTMTYVEPEGLSTPTESSHPEEAPPPAFEAPAVMTAPATPEPPPAAESAPVAAMPTPDPAPAAPPPPSRPGSDLQGLIDLDQAQVSQWTEAGSDDQLAGRAFQKLQKHYALSMILMLEGNQLKVWKWQKGFQISSLPSVDVNAPSLFRVVHRTQLPYHGYVVESPANMEFFKSCGVSPIPQHVTAQALVMEGHLLGVLLCLGDISANTEESMLFSERVAHELIQGFKKINQAAA